MMIRSRKEQMRIAAELSLCPQCTFHFLSPKTEDVLQTSWKSVEEDNLQNMTYLMHTNSDAEAREVLGLAKGLYESRAQHGHPMCFCCFGALSYDTLEILSAQVLQAVAEKTNDTAIPMYIEVLVPPIMDAYRITARTAITRHADKVFPFPSVDELVTRILTAKLADRLNIVPSSEARIKISLKQQADYQMEYCLAVWEDFKIKKVKRKFLPGQQLPKETSQVEPTDGNQAHEGSEEQDISRKSIDSLLMYYKTLDIQGLENLRNRLVAYMHSLSQSGDKNGSHSRRVAWKVTSKACPVFLLGRYRKLARDVPQSPWTVATATHSNAADPDGEGEDDVDAGLVVVDAGPGDAVSGAAAYDDAGPAAKLVCTTASCVGEVEAAVAQSTAGGQTALQYQRKGRASVEEIVNAEVKRQLQAAECRMHPCGREDIDVRCLGNGRPFAMEVQDPGVIFPDQALLDSIRQAINRGDGLNAERDVELALLTVADRACWETMQTKAEEKRKGYCCVVWVEKGLTVADLRNIEALSRSGAMLDEAGEPCIQLMQKTPLRVLHRRSLLDRTRYIYQIETTLLNNHFFLMRLVTSAGTYVKEFVHGDMGRTSPSISSLLQCQADIMQLDVTWLYDDLEGNDAVLKQLNGQGCEDRDGLNAVKVSEGTIPHYGRKVDLP